MGWETCARGGRYYTRSRKVRGRVVREYVGAGLIGELSARGDAEERAARHERAATMRRDQASWEAVERPVAELDDLVGAVAAGALLLAGYHCHHRGEWRRRREGNGEGD